MPNIDFKFWADDKALAVIDVLRGSAVREDFFRRAIEIGICELIESAARMNLDYLTQTMTGQTSDYRVVRGQLFAIGEPKTEAPKSSSELKDPMMGLKPRGEPRG